MLNMGAVKGFDVFLDDPLEVYHVGETLRGHVVLTLTKDLAMKGNQNGNLFGVVDAITNKSLLVNL